MARAGAQAVPRAHCVAAQSGSTRRRVEITLTTFPRTGLVGACWLATLAVVLACSVVMGAQVSTSVLLLLLGIAPVVVAVLIGGGAPPPTVAEILHSVNTKDGVW